MSACISADQQQEALIILDDDRSKLAGHKSLPVFGSMTWDSTVLMASIATLIASPEFSVTSLNQIAVLTAEMAASSRDLQES
jgi:hypothetical protein